MVTEDISALLKKLDGAGDLEKERILMEEASRSAISNACLTMEHMNPGEGVSQNAHCTVMVHKSVNGDTEPIKTLLMAQAFTLDALFREAIKRAAGYSDLQVVQTYFDIALKAQKQSRQNLSALAAVINPPESTYVRQQNNAVNQQVNNGVGVIPEKKSANELLMEAENEALDTRGTFKTVVNDSELETVGVLNGSQDG